MSTGYSSPDNSSSSYWTCLSKKNSRRRRTDKDPEAIRGTLERFFPGAQYQGDGKTIDVSVGPNKFSFCWELLVDTKTGAHTGSALRDNEDGQAVIDAVENSISNTATKPLAVLLDNRPSNHSEEVTQALDKHEILLMSSTPGRPENKASVEGAFGLFSQTMPDITLPLDSPKALGYAVLSYVLFAYSAGRNQVPRPALGNRSAAEAFRSAHITPEQRKQAKLSLEAIKRRIKQQLKNDWKQTNPTIRGLLFDAFVDMGLSDPQRRFIPAIAKYGLEAATEAIATFKARQNAGTAPTDFPERYLLGIARNIARRNLNEAVYEELLRLRLKANDALLRPLLYEKKRLWRSLSPRDLSLETLERALSSSATIDRAFWKLDFLSTLESLPSLLRQGIARFAAQQVARAFSLPIRERESFIAALAARARPIPQAHQTRPRPTR